MDIKAEQDGEVYGPLPMLLRVPTVTAFRAVACGYNHTGAVSVDGRLFMWGNGNSGRLGLGATQLKTVRVPTLVKSLADRGMHVWSISCGAAHTAITTRIVVEEGGGVGEPDEGATNVTGGGVLVTGAGWALGREQLDTFAVVSAFKDVRVCVCVCVSLSLSLSLSLCICVHLCVVG